MYQVNNLLKHELEISVKSQTELSDNNASYPPSIEGHPDVQLNNMNNEGTKQWNLL